MKKITLHLKPFAMILLTIALSISAANAQDKMQKDVENAKAEFIKTDPMMKSLFENAYAYVIFPNVGKGAVGIGGAAGQGIVYQHGKQIGTAKMKQITVGFQAGGQAYREVIFFENDASLNSFKSDDLEFSGQASAVAVTKGASGNVKYKEGVMIFSQQKGGLMYEASVGGQKFDFTANK